MKRELKRKKVLYSFYKTPKKTFMTFNQVLSVLRERKIKIWIEDGEIKYKGPKGSMDGDIRSILKGNKDLIIQALKSVTAKPDDPIIEKVSRDSNLPASHTQQGIWFTCQFSEYSSIYNMVMAFEVIGELDVEIFQAAINRLVTRYEILRTNFSEVAGVVEQVIHKKRMVTAVFNDYQHNPELAKSFFKELLAEESKYCFDLKNDPLLKTGLIKIAEGRWYVWVNVHHIIFDGWSSNIFFSELIRIYNIENKKEPVFLTIPEIQFADYSQWQRSRLSGNRYEVLKDFWSDYLKGMHELTQLPLQKPRQSNQSFKAAVIDIKLDTAKTKEFLDYTNELALTPYMAFFSVFALLVFKYSQQRDIVIGTVTANRSAVQTQSLIGCLVNVIPVRTLLDSSSTFAQFASSFKQNILRCFSHQEMPFDKLVDELNHKRSLSYNPVVQLMFNMNTTLSEKMDMEGLQLIPFEREIASFGTYDLQLEMKLNAGSCLASFVYNSELFDPLFIERFANHYLNILTSISLKSETAISKLLYLNQPEINQLLIEFNDTNTKDTQSKTIIKLFEKQVQTDPDKIAVVFEDSAISFGELNKRANRLGNYLREKYKIKADDLVAIKLEPGEWMIVALLGILKSGGAYVPIDPDYPQQRIDYIIKDSKSKVLIDENELTRFRSEGKNYDNNNLRSINKVSDLIYVIYTSGSTGKPKGCMLEQKGVINRIEWMWEEFKFSQEDVVLQKTPYTFDVSVWELFMPLCRGAKIILCQKKDIVSPERLLALIERHKITCLHFVPSMLSAFIATLFDDNNIGKRLGSLRKVVASGEALTIETIKNWYKKMNIDIHNLYGPTEASIEVTCYTTTKEDSKVPIGKPIWNTQIYILDEDLQLVPIGVTGEIHIGGRGLARAYINDPVQTAERFILNPFGNGDRIYKTGDIGRWLPDGNIEFIGRKDDQVKIRGYRIELAEVETAIKNYFKTTSEVVVVTTAKDGDKELVAYIVSKEFLNTAELKAFLHSTLPSYMLPSYYVQIEAMPLLPNGKVNKKALPDPESLGNLTGTEYVPPGNAVEQKLVMIWEEILNKRKIGIKDNFFELGGHSLKAIQLANKIHKEFEVKIEIQELFTSEILEKQAILIQQARKLTYKNIVPVVTQSSYQLSSSQRRLWVTCQTENSNIAYNMSGAYIFEEDVDRAAFDYAVKILIERHEILRTVFKEDDQGEMRQFVLSPDEIRYEIHYRDLTTEAGQNARLKMMTEEEFLRPFDLSSAPLFRISLYQLTRDKCLFIFITHHIISDAWSMGILINEVSLFYNAYTQNEPAQIKPLTIQYKDYASWLQEQLSGEIFNTHKEYWLKRLSGELPVLDLPEDRVRPVMKTYNGGTIHRIIESRVFNGIKRLSAEQGGTLFMGLLTSLYTLLYKYTDKKDIIVGTPIVGRNHLDLENQIGFYVNTLPLRIQFTAEENFKELVQKIKKIIFEALEHGNYPFDELVDSLSYKRDMSRNAFFDVMLVLENTENTNKKESLKLEELFVKELSEINIPVSKFDLSFHFIEDRERLKISIEYNSDIYNKNTVEKMAGHLEQLMDALINEPGKPIKQLSCLGSSEQRQLLKEFNSTSVDYTSTKTIVQLFEEQVLKDPNQTALLFEEVEYSYETLNERSNQMASYLRSNYKINSGDLVALKLERDEWMIVSMLGILKSGAAYVPVDPGYPPKRIDYMISDSRCKLLIDEAELIRFRETAHRYPEENIGLINKAEDLAYVIYTSGSTGMPKGVMIEHKNVSSFLSWALEEFGRSKFDTVFGSTSICFDLSVFEIFYSLIAGKKLRLLKNALSIPDYLKNGESVLLNTVPSVVGFLLAEKVDLSSVNVLNMAGEPIPQKYIGELEPGRIELRNLYGPTEGTTYSTIYRITNKDDNILIGRPVSNTRIYILNENEQLQPVGVIGEICISGDGLARGYLNKADLTAEKFVMNPFEEGKRMYKTGDMGKWLADGNIEFIGRKDYQVKLRGYRIELGEIQKALAGFPSINEAFVIAKQSNATEKELFAFIVTSVPTASDDLRKYLLEQLPEFMIPDHYIELKALPRTPNGKVDNIALIAGAEPAKNNGKYKPASNVVEMELVKVWKELLQADHIGVNDNFFELGGHSLKAIRLMNIFQKLFNVKIPLHAILRHPTIHELATLIIQSEKSNSQKIPRIPLHSYYPISDAQRPLWIMSQFEEGSRAYNISMAMKLTGELNIEYFSQAFDHLIDRHEILRTVFYENERAEPSQWILTPSEMNFKLEYEDLVSKEDRESLCQHRMAELDHHLFDLHKGPMIKALLMKLEADQYVLSFCIHHIISDGWSLEVIARDIMSIYSSLLAKVPNSLPVLKIQYKDYTAWLQRQLMNTSLMAHRDYWLKRFEGELPAIDFPSQKLRPIVKTYNGYSLRIDFSPEVVNNLRKHSQEAGGTLFMGLVTCLKGFLSRYTGQNDIILGSSIAGQEHEDLMDQIGFYVNTVALRTRFDLTNSFFELFSKVKETILGAIENRLYPLHKLLDDLGLKKGLGRSPLFDMVVSYEGVSYLSSNPIPESPHLKMEVLERKHRLARFDITFSFIEQQEGVVLDVEYNADIHDKTVMDRFALHFKSFVEKIAANPHEQINTINYLSEAEKIKIIGTFNSSDLSFHYPKNDTLVHIFSKQVRKTPMNVAVQTNRVKLTYKELDEVSNRLAHYIAEMRSGNTNELIAVRLERNEWLIAAILAVMKSGNTYLPIDPAYSPLRIDYIMESSNCEFTIDKDMLDDFIAVQEDYSSDSIDVRPSPEDLAYVIYTSGSTGHPKGVMIEHKSILNTILAQIELFEIEESDRCLQFASQSFDASVSEIFITLLSGAQLNIIDELEKHDLRLFSGYLVENDVSWATIPPAYMKMLDPSVIHKLQKIVTAGEQAYVNKALLSKRSGYYINAYGPTETSICATIYKGPVKDPLPIGKPIYNTKIYILDEFHFVVPIGVTGEIYIAGAGLAKGYLNRNDLTKSSFIPNPFVPGELLYKTGDFGRWLTDGTIEFIGRKDTQVKVNGYRIELEEIENVLIQLTDWLEQAVLDVREVQREKVLVAYVVGKKDLDKALLRDALAQRLPAYMIPQYFIEVDKIPLNQSGKVDRRALPNVQSGDVLREGYVAPSNDVEKKLVEIWKEVLGLDKISVTDKFFDIGGTSLKLIELHQKINDTFETQIPIVTLFKKLTIAEFSKELLEVEMSSNNQPEDTINIIAFENEG